MDRRRFLKTAAGLFVPAAPAIIRPASAQMWPFPGPGRAASGSGSTTTWNPSDKNANVTLSNGNLTATGTSAAYGNVRAVASASSGKKYWEITINTRVTPANNFVAGGVGTSATTLSNFIGTNVPTADSIGWASDGSVYKSSSNIGSVQTYAAGDTLCFALDIGNGSIWFRTNGGNWNNSGTADPTTNTGGRSLSGISAGALFPIGGTGNQNGDVITANFGATAYAQSVPSGYGNW